MLWATKGGPPMFEESSFLYDAIYDATGKDYRREAETVESLIKARHRAPASLLDVACGTGRHLEYFARELHCAGVDVNPVFLDAARSRCPGLELVQADMVDFVLDERFDAVTCLFSSIGYVGSLERLHRAVASMARCLNPGGVLVVEPWFEPAAWRTGVVSSLTIDTSVGKAVRMVTSTRRQSIAVLDFHYLVGTSEGVEHFVEHHELGLFTWEQYREAFEAVGLRTEVLPGGLTGRGL